LAGQFHCNTTHHPFNRHAYHWKLPRAQARRPRAEQECSPLQVCARRGAVRARLQAGRPPRGRARRVDRGDRAESARWRRAAAALREPGRARPPRERPAAAAGGEGAARRRARPNSRGR
jgi:hypothetical protein